MGSSGEGRPKMAWGDLVTIKTNVDSPALLD
jgi:hypothetical protein